MPGFSGLSTTSQTNTSSQAPAEKQEIDLQSTYSVIMNNTYYSIFLPVTLIGNTLSIAVVAVIVYHKRNRRSIADLLLGALAMVDLLSLLTVHTVSLVFITKEDHRLPKNVSVFQGFAASVYMKLQFLIQICISLDRYLALVRPLQYNTRFTSRRVMVIISMILITVTSSSSILLATTCPPQIRILPTWPMSLLKWSFHCVPHAIVAILTCVIFTVGSIVFISCNLNLVRILWQYHSQREQINEFSHVVNVLEKKVSQHLQASQSTLHKHRVNSILAESRSNSLRPPEVHVQATPDICNGDANNWNQKNLSNQTNDYLKVASNSLMINNHSNEKSISSDNSYYHSASEGDNKIGYNEIGNEGPKNKVKRTKNVHNLKLVINVQEPTSSPEAGTPDSQSKLMEKISNEKISVENECKITPETPEIRIEGHRILVRRGLPRQMP